MSRTFSPVVALALILGALCAQAAGAQQPAPGLIPHADLTATLKTGPEAGSFAPDANVLAIPLHAPSTAAGKLFNDAPPPEGGWKGLAKLLEAVTPGADTSVPLTASEITTRISRMLDQGQNQQALDVIEKREAQYEAQGTTGTDVQLLFLRGRALAALGRHQDAVAVYRNMTTLYPELPEPWNNLASEYVKQGKLELAHDALSMALANNPNYGTAQANMGRVQLMLAQRSFQEAARLGIAGSKRKAQAAQDILEN
ncbi:MAG TPA: tetratricopeptide repeat protein [Candidimonas sp.]|nr:tetratricopeptide repeat protein [Candidimonas sp.]